MRDVERLHVSRLPPEELRNINDLKCDGDPHGIADISMPLVLRGGERYDDQRPAHQSEAAIGKHFDVPSEYLRMKLRAPEIIENHVARMPVIRAGRIKTSFQIQEQAESKTRQIERPEKLSKMIVDN